MDFNFIGHLQENVHGKLKQTQQIIIKPKPTQNKMVVVSLPPHKM
jgi:hypothetical protein